MRLFLVLLLALVALPARAETALIAVATNFAGAAEALAAGYAAATGHEVAFSAGATGKLYAQISAGAPFDAFLSADAAAPGRLEAEGRAVPGTRFTYALGALVLWSPDPGADLADPIAALRAARHVAIANPDLAPFGKAAVETLETLEISSEIAGRLVMGENIGQAHTLVASGAADLGFVAASSLVPESPGAAWPVPAGHHAPIRQDAVLLQHGAANAAAQGFLDYLRSDAARATIASFGYGPGSGPAQ